jgi:hypothetical protein
MAASDAADTLFEAHLAANWNATPLYTENDGEEHEDSRVYFVYWETESDVEEQASMGAGEDEGTGDLHRETGVLRLYVVGPSGDGTKKGRLLRDQLAALFTRANRDIGTVTCLRLRRTGGLVWEGEKNGNWWAFPLIVEWERDN